jgi:hypothetical protein
MRAILHCGLRIADCGLVFYGRCPVSILTINRRHCFYLAV